MDTLKLGQPLDSREPRVLLDPSLKPGRYVARLVVRGPSGESVPAQVVLVVVRGG
ncbi:MAG TPA: hypothetical protein VFS42_03985 [Burkholderiaceae bacterium]|nr:hypothetical protein [Burkholderiaceae bacterium]